MLRILFGFIHEKIVLLLQKDIILYKTILFNLLSKLVLIFSQILLVPFYLNFWSSELYGEWLIITTIPSYLMFTDLGLNATASTEICKLTADKKYLQANELYQSINSCFVIVGFFLILIFFTINNFIEIKEVLNLNIIDSKSVSLILFFFVLSILFSFFQGFLLSIFRANGAFHLTQVFTTGGYLLDIFLNVLVVYFKFPLFFIPITLILSRLVIVFLAFQKLREINWFKFGFSKNLSLGSKLIPTSIDYSLITIGYSFFLQGNTLLVGKFLGSQSVVTFNTIRTLVNTIKSILSIVFSSFLPVFTVLLTQVKMRDALNKAKVLVILTITNSLFLCVSLYLFGNTILKYWVKGEIKIIEPFYILMLSSAFFQTVWNSLSIIPLSINRNKILRIYPVFGIINFILLIVFIEKYGLTSVAMLLLITDVFMFFMVINEVVKVLRLKLFYTILQKYYGKFRISNTK